MTGPERVLGVDLGTKRVGISLSDAMGWTAQPLETLAYREKTIVPEIAALAVKHEAVRIVLGLPLRLNGEEGEAAAAARAFGERLAAATGLPVEYVDERLTSAAANRILSQTEMSGGKKRAAVDRMAAALILQTWLDQQARKKG